MQRSRSSKILQHVIVDVSGASLSLWNTRIALQSLKLLGQQISVHSQCIHKSFIEETWRFQPRPVTHSAAFHKPQHFCSTNKVKLFSSSFSRTQSSLAVTAGPKTEGFRDVSSHTTDLVRTVRHYGQCYWELSKARLSMLVVMTTGAGFVMGSGLAIDYIGLSWTCMGTLFIAAAANTINQILEVENDSRMRRTMHRPLPAGRITRQHAMAWAAVASIGGVTLLANQANIIAAGLGVINLVLYTLVYTPLKQVHPMNTWVGAVVGAVPPLLGWAAAAGEVSTGSWLLASALYFWQLPHFMAIAYLCRQDYATGGFRMLSMQDTSGHRTALVALRNCGYLLPLGFLAHHCGVTTAWFGFETVFLTAGMGTTAALFYCKPTADRARKLFRASLLYLPFLMVAMLCHRSPNVKGNVYEGECLTNNSFDRCTTLSEMKEDDPGVHIGENRPRKLTQPPVAFFSVAPFPFLPAPDY